MRKKVIVLGSSGYIGRAFVSYLKNQGMDIVTAGRKGCDVNADISKDCSELVDFCCEGDYVVFLAAISSPEICKNNESFAYLVNVTATLEIIEQLTSKGVRVVFSSSDVVFGRSPYACSDDSSALYPFGSYGNMKATVEGRIRGNDLVKVVRFSFVVGPGDNFTDMLKEASFSGTHVSIFKGFERSVVALDDVLEGLARLIVKWDLTPNQTINFCGPACISRAEIAASYSEIINNVDIEVVDAPEGFWNSRPKKIHMTSTTFSNLLGRRARSVSENLIEWKKL